MNKTLLSRKLVGIIWVLFGGMAMADVPMYRVFETTLTNSNAYGNKFVDVELQAEFTSPCGLTTSWRGFFDGDGNGRGDYQTGSVWRLRFMLQNLLLIETHT